MTKSLFLCVVLSLACACARKTNYIVADRDMADAAWLPYNDVEISENLPVCERETHCRHVVDSKGSFGGIISAQIFTLVAGEEYEVGFKVKVNSGLAAFQVLQNRAKAPANFTYTNLIERKWTAKRYRFIATVDSTEARINFTNARSSESVDFMIDDFYFRKLSLWQRTFKTGEMF